MMNIRVALFLIAIYPLPVTALAQNHAGSPAGTTCPAAADVDSQRLYGSWQAQVDVGGAARQALLTLTQNPRYSGSLGGTIVRGSATAQVAGDVDDGAFTLEESSDGRTITATWTGEVVEGSCGREIRGTWKDVADQRTHDFVLRRPPN
jgi:hypothetical protein